MTRMIKYRDLKILLNTAKRLSISSIALFWVFVIYLYFTSPYLDSEPLLDQPTDIDFFKSNILVSLSLPYLKSASSKENSVLLTQAVLSALLWQQKTEARVSLQVFNDTKIRAEDEDILFTLSFLPDISLSYIYDSLSPCDLVTQASLARFWPPNSDEEILVVAGTTSFISKPKMLNVLKTSHSLWLFNSEQVLYHAQPWSSQLMAIKKSMITNLWGSTDGCQAYLNARQNMSHHETLFMPSSNSIDLVMTRNILQKKICSLPKHNEIWNLTRTEEYYDPFHIDRDTCFRGMNIGGCNHSHQGYWYAAGMQGCSWWIDTLPQEVLEDILPASHPLQKAVDKYKLTFMSS